LAEEVPNESRAGRDRPGPLPRHDREETTQLRLHAARAQGDAYGNAFAQLRATGTTDSGEEYCGDYWIGYAVGPAMGVYEWTAAELAWREPEAENLHVAITVRDAGDGRFVPGLRVIVTLIDPTGNVVGSREQPLLWHPMIYHYGGNWKVEASGVHSLQVTVEPPKFMRTDVLNGDRLLAPAEVDFDSVKVDVGTG
jgi:hypothetical protein